jgi:hypothetical protein
VGHGSKTLTCGPSFSVARTDSFDPDKTFIDRIEKGFDFLDYHFGPEGLRVATATIQNFVEHARRLYEQEQDAPNRDALLRAYVKRWVGGAKPGLGFQLRSRRTPVHPDGQGTKSPQKQKQGGE